MMKRFLALAILLCASVAQAAPVDPVGKNSSGKIVSATRVLTSLLSGPLTCDVASSALPAGAATESTLRSIDTRLVSQATAANQSTANGYLSTIATNQCTAANQATGNASLASIDSKLTAPLTVTGPITDTQLRASPVAVSASSLPLPTGAANAVAQGSTTSGQTGELVQAAVTTNAPTYTNGQTSPLNMGTSGGLRTQQIGDSFTWISTAGSYGIRTGAGILRRVIVGSNVAGGINCYDNTAGSGTVIVSLTTTTSTPFNYVEVGAAFKTGLYCVTTGTGESFTVVYAPAT